MERTLNIHPKETSQATFQDRLLYDRLSFFYISLPIFLLGQFFGASLLCIIMYNKVYMPLMVLWAGVFFAMFAYQLYNYYRFKSLPETSKLIDGSLWLDRYYTHVLLNGFIWGSSALLIFPQDDFAYQVILMLFLFAVGFSSMGVLASKTDLLLAFAVVMYGPLMGKLATLKEPIYTTLLIIVFSLVILMILAAHYYGKIIHDMLHARQHFIEIKQNHEKLKERFFSLFEKAPVGIYYYNRNLELEDTNIHFVHMNKAKHKDDLIGLNLHGFCNGRIIQAHEEVFKGKTGKYRGPFEAIHTSESLYVNLSTVPMYDPEGSIAGGITILSDITNEVTAKEEMIKSAYYDTLTKVPNRTLLMDKLTALLEQKHHHHSYGAIIYIEIDNFKKVNEIFGHQVGDQLLKHVAQRLKSFAGINEFFARVNENHFVILLSSLDEHKEQSTQIARHYIENLYRYFHDPLDIVGEEFHITFTIGVELFNHNATSPYDLLKHSETAMLEAKKMSRGTYKFFTPKMLHVAKKELLIASDIRKAIQNNEFSIYYQPQQHIKTNHVLAAEALVRWKHPQKGFIGPNTFIPIAEESGIIVKLEEVIFEHIFQNIAHIASQHQGNFPLDHIAINISTMHFLQPHFVEQFLLRLQRHQIKPEWIEIELTESGIMTNIEETIRKVKELKTFGIRFSIDDFGTSYSSLAHLHTLPVDMIKIDQSFIQDLDINSGSSVVAETIIAIGKKLNVEIVAEGVEKDNVLKMLQDMGCDYYQGNLRYKPMPFDRFSNLISHP